MRRSLSESSFIEKKKKENKNNFSILILSIFLRSKSENKILWSTVHSRSTVKERQIIFSFQQLKCEKVSKSRSVQLKEGVLL
jgi:hypothetical protein